MRFRMKAGLRLGYAQALGYIGLMRGKRNEVGAELG
jgi:hypothetical protein